MNILAIDPGFDVTGWALFSILSPPATIQEAVSALREAGEIDCRDQDGHAARLYKLSGQVRTKILSHEIPKVVVEFPAYAGDYGNNPARRQSVNKLYMALGAITGTIHPERFVRVPALTTAKDTRHELLAYTAQSLGVELPRGPRGGKQEDAWDAIWIGCQAMLERTATFWPKAVPKAVQ